VQQELLELFGARRGHFRFESGHHGDLWLEVPRAFLNPVRLRRYAAELARLLGSHRVEAVCGPLVEGAFLAQMVAEQLHLEFYFAEQFARGSATDLYPIGYRIPHSLRAAVAGKRTALVDDVINAGSAVRGAIDDLEACGAKLVAIGSLMVLGPRADALAASHVVGLETLARIPESALWPPSSCPLCASGVPLEELR